MKKVLIVATVESHILNFHIPFIKMFIEKGYSVDVACSGQSVIEGVSTKFDVNFPRNPLSKHTFKAYKAIKKIINENNYDIIQVNTPVGSVLSRLASKKAKKRGTKIYYMAHGFHFFKGAPFKYWLMFYPIEKYLSKFTDLIITMNEEDYVFASKKFSCPVYKINGVGINLNVFNSEKSIIKEKYDKISLISVGELTERKNQILAIKTVKILVDRGYLVDYSIVGDGEKEDYFKTEIKKLGLTESIHLLGLRNDIHEIIREPEIFISTSKQEGLPVNIIEAMANLRPIIVTNCRGNRDLISNNINGLVSNYDERELANKIIELHNNFDLKVKFNLKNKNLIHNYSLESVLIEVEKIYFGTN